MKKIFIILCFVFLALLLLSFDDDSRLVDIDVVARDKVDEHNFDPINSVDTDNVYISYSEFRLTIAHANASSTDILIQMQNRKISIDTAQELYLFSVDVSYSPEIYHNTKFSYEVIETLLSLDYVLGNDIDYEVMGASKFIPIGYSFVSLDEIIISNVFTGTFDGRGFEISNLYLAGYDEVIIEEGEDATAVDISTISYYAMFSHNEGTIKNLGLVNPTLELLNEHDDLTRAANLVGVNDGVVEYVYVIDDRENILDAGIRMKAATGTSITRYRAAGIVYENNGIFSNAYFVSNVTVNASYINNFIVQPVLFINNGSISNLVYDSSTYLLTISIGNTIFNVTTPNEYATPEETELLKATSSLGSEWYYYENDRYPALFGLEYYDGKYLINDALDLVAFSKVLKYNTPKNNQIYREAHYIITGDINMSQVGKAAYKTPNVEFSGKLSGEKGNGENYYISHLHIIDGVTIDNNYYSGVVSVLSGEIRNITFYNANLVIKNTNEFYSHTFYIGGIAGKLENGGNINDISLNITIDLGTEAIGELHCGSVVGNASGIVMGIYAQGLINANTHEFSSDQSIEPVYIIAGLVGSTGVERLTLYNALSEVNVKGIASSTNIASLNSEAKIIVGGIIGSLVNTNQVKHDLGMITNEGNILVNEIQSTIPVKQYIGGVIGLSEGASYTFNEFFGTWTNKGNIEISNGNSNEIRSAGIAVSNHNQNVEFIYVYNHGSFTNSGSNFNYTALIYDMSNSGVVLSQSINHASYEITSNYNFSGVFFSENNTNSLLRFVENKGDITIADRVLEQETSIAGITLSTNVNFLNVYYSGQIILYNIQSNQSIWVSGISKHLSPNKYMINSLSEGDITIANITSQNNIYIGGLVNISYAGDLHLQDQSNYPVANTGVINSINYGNITSTFNNEIYGIYGYGNVYAGGIVTLNGGSIQDTANLGDITITNLENIDASSIIVKTSQYDAGLMESFAGGLSLAGVTATVINGNSRIYDSANNGDVIGIAKYYVRAAGILAVSLYDEIEAGSVPLNLVTDNIENSILSNCINYGDISAISEVIADYSDDTTDDTTFNGRYFFVGGTQAGDSVSIPTKTATEERPAIYSSAGGVIGYGLSVMRRMLNHGNISATDVSGGIVGATYVIGSASGSTTNVNIDTAIHYGSVRAIDNQYFNNIDKINIVIPTQYFYEPESSFIFPQTRSDITRAPESKRGFGGIFGRLQRGLNGVMTSENGNFDYIVNTDANVDLIGRLDQVLNFTSSARFFRFNDCIYFSARENDTTQAVFTGFRYIHNPQGSDDIIAEATNKRITYVRETVFWFWYRWTITTEYYVESGTKYPNGDIYEKVGIISDYIESEQPSQLQQSQLGWIVTDVEVTETTTNSNQHPRGTFYEEYNGTLYDSMVVPDYRMGENIPINQISEYENQNGEYMYDGNFIMRDDNTILPNGEKITSYIYYIENEILSDRFRETRPSGMYVLSTTAGSDFGSVLPANIEVSNIFRLEQPIPYDSNYNQIGIEDKTNLDENIMNSYKGLMQTRYNDRSELLEEDQTFEMSEVGGSNTTLSKPIIDYEDKRITFEISLEAFDPLQTYAEYQISKALIPAYALIGARVEDYLGGSYQSDLESFKDLLLVDEGLVISQNVPAILAIEIEDYMNITSNTLPISMGYFTAYSQASINNTIFLNEDYTTDYQVFVILKPNLDNSPGGISPIVITVDGNLQTYNDYLINPNKVEENINIEIEDTANVLTQGTTVDDVVLYYDNALVTKDYYSVSKSAVDNQGRFNISLDLSQELRSGEYIVKYKLYPSSIENDFNFIKDFSSEAMIKTISHYSFDEFSPTHTTFTTYINYGYDLSLDMLSWNENINHETPTYLNNTSYIISYLDNFEISPFATLTSVIFEDITYSNGYKTYHMVYVIQAEDGITNNTYYHNIIEREVTIDSVYRNNNRVNIANVFSTREAVITNFSIDFGLDNNLGLYNLFDENPNSYFSIAVRGEMFSGIEYSHDQIIGLNYSADVYLNVSMNNQTLPGNYYFTFSYHRNGEITNILPELNIRKNEGVSAYLKDIKFSESALETSYPRIYVSDNQGEIIISPYTPRVYFRGIDYNNADISGENNFRINGQVANTPLNEYTPYFLEYLPSGATISRLAYDQENPNGYWTPEVVLTSENELKAHLATDFTLIPQTGEEPGEDGYAIITYRVTSEDGMSQVYYHITVIDIIYNVSIVFEFFYEEDGQIYLAEDSELQFKTLLLTVKNFETNIIPGIEPAQNVEDFLDFNEIIEYNNSTSMFYVPYLSTYRYRFGRNISGFYSFDIDLPSQEYQYWIVFNGTMLPDISEYVDNGDGKYYYIETGTRNRTRRFQVYVSRTSETYDPQWGISCNKDTWKQ